MAFTHDQAIDIAVAEIRRMAAVCEGADPATPVPTCPEWTLADLVRHTGQIHRWATAMVDRSSQERIRREAFDWVEPDDPTALPGWLAEGAAALEKTFRAADPATPMWAWGWPKTAGFWPRRMIHETGVHRADAELALGGAAAFDPEVAADGVDELLDNLPHAAYFAPGVAELVGAGEVLTFRTPEAAWTIRFRADGFDWARGADGEGDGALAAPSTGDLLLTLYRRRSTGPTEITGDATLVRRWLDNSAL